MAVLEDLINKSFSEEKKTDALEGLITATVEDNIEDPEESIFVTAEEITQKKIENITVAEQKPYGEGSLYETETDFLSGHKNYTFYLSQFEGPLDLLCNMLKNQEIKIEDFFLSELTEQYIEIVTNANLSIDMDYAGEFITTLAELLYIKSVRLLPIEKDIQVDAEDPEQDFLRRLKEYQMFSEMATRIKTTETINRFGREPVYTEKDYQLSIKNFSFEKLIDAFALLISRLDREEDAIEPKIVRKERYSVANRMSFISMKIFTERKMTFFSLFEEDFEKIEICNTFFALLELVNQQHVIISQAEDFGDIMIELGEGVEKPIYIDEAENRFKEIEQQAEGI